MARDIARDQPAEYGACNQGDCADDEGVIPTQDAERAKDVDHDQGRHAGDPAQKPTDDTRQTASPLSWRHAAWGTRTGKIEPKWRYAQVYAPAVRASSARDIGHAVSPAFHL